MSLTFKPDSELASHPVNIAFHFMVMVGLETLGDFQAVEGLSFGAQVRRYNEGGRNHSPHLLRWDGPGERGEVTLRWGMMTRPSLYQWAMAVERGYVFRKPVYILQLDRQKSPIRLIMLFRCFPTQWSMGALDANSNNWSVEELTLAYEDIGVIAIPPDILSFFGGELDNIFSSGTKVDVEDSSVAFDDGGAAEDLEAFQELDDWLAEQEAMEELLAEWDNMTEEERAAYMEAHGITDEDIEQYKADHDAADEEQTEFWGLAESRADAAPEDGEEEEAGPVSAWTEGGEEEEASSEEAAPAPVPSAFRAEEEADEAASDEAASDEAASEEDEPNASVPSAFRDFSAAEDEAAEDEAAEDEAAEDEPGDDPSDTAAED